MKKPLAFAIILGAVAALCTALYLNGLETEYKKKAERIKVQVASRYIDQGTMIEDSLAEDKLMPKEYLQPKAILSKKDLVNSEGRPVFIALVPIEQGEQIVTTKLSMLGADTGISAITPTDKRAVTLLFDGKSVAGIIKPGNRVDIIGIFEFENTASRIQEEALTILQNVLVLSVGNSFLGVHRSTWKSKDEQEAMLAIAGENETADVIPVSFAVTPQEAESLTLAAEKGTIKLALRATGDSAVFATRGVRMKDICQDVSLTAKSPGINSPAITEASFKEMQKKQKEVMYLLRKYQK